ncbi:MAG: hypothetical protein Q8O14_02040 [bacterium]|nr:hypothetical protein [bacterium]
MRKALWLALVPALLFASSDPTEPADTPGAVAPAHSGIAVVAPLAPSAVDLAHKEAMMALALERQAFVEAFNWNRGGDRVETARLHARAMDGFHRRELELKRDWYAASGQLDRLAAIEAALVALEEAGRPQPELDLPRPAAQPQEVTP